MKNGIKLLFGAILLVTAACGSSSSSVKSPQNMTLVDHINQIDGVRITGNGEYAQVIVSQRKLSAGRQGQGWGGKMDSGYRDSIDNPPLFIIDGQEFGTDFQALRDMLTNREIKSAKLLSKDQAYNYYGDRSFYGVIEITTK